jgi:putative toxin-antitoxin system antitoxin component (TIGR02293 family)
MTAISEKISARPNTRYTIERLLGVKTADNLKLAKRIESGLSFDALERLARTTGLSLERLRVAVRITPRTLTRRRQEKKLSPEESDRLVSVSRLLALTFELFEGRVDEGLRWFTEPNRALGGITPIEAAATEAGAREIENLIGRLEYGVYT